MYSPAIINPEQAFHPLPSRSDDCFNLVLPLQSFSEGDPFVVEIPPYFSFGQIDFNASAQSSFLILDTTLSTQPSLCTELISDFGYYSQYPDRTSLFGFREYT